MQKAETAAVVSKKLPLLSNLNMLENIALIPEVHQSMQVKQAESLALEYLQKLGQESVALNRLAQCNETEVFYVKLIRAILAPKPEVLIVMPTTLIDSQQSTNFICDAVTKLATDKTVSIIDLKTNENHYLGESCIIQQ